MQGDIPTLLATDQLRKEMLEGRAFYGFKEPDITFAPTFKVQRQEGLQYQVGGWEVEGGAWELCSRGGGKVGKGGTDINFAPTLKVQRQEGLQYQVIRGGWEG